MRGGDERSGSLFSYVDLEGRVGKDHPLRIIRGVVNEALVTLARSEVARAAAHLRTHEQPAPRGPALPARARRSGPESIDRSCVRPRLERAARWWAGVSRDGRFWLALTLGIWRGASNRTGRSWRPADRTAASMADLIEVRVL